MTLAPMLRPPVSRPPPNRNPHHHRSSLDPTYRVGEARDTESVTDLVSPTVRAEGQNDQIDAEQYLPNSSRRSDNVFEQVTVDLAEGERACHGLLLPSALNLLHVGYRRLRV